MNVMRPCFYRKLSGVKSNFPMSSVWQGKSLLWENKQKSVLKLLENKSQTKGLWSLSSKGVLMSPSLTLPSMNKTLFSPRHVLPPPVLRRRLISRFQGQTLEVRRLSLVA